MIPAVSGAAQNAPVVEPRDGNSAGASPGGEQARQKELEKRWAEQGPSGAALPAGPEERMPVPVVETFLLPPGTSVRTIITLNGREQTVEFIGAESRSVSGAGTALPRPVPPSVPLGVKVRPRMPDPRSGLVYRVQVGAYLKAGNAESSFNRLRAAGFSPAYERKGNYHRVIISGVRAADMRDVVRRLGSAGFSEVWLRE
jgi:hypothetical protein